MNRPHVPGTSVDQDAVILEGLEIDPEGLWSPVLVPDSGQLRPTPASTDCYGLVLSCLSTQATFHAVLPNTMPHSLANPCIAKCCALISAVYARGGS